MKSQSKSEWEKEKVLILISMRVAIARNPKKVLHGNYLVLDCPTPAYIPKGWTGQRRAYTGWLEGDGDIVVRTLEGYEVIRGDLGSLWFSPPFNEHRYAYETDVNAE